MARRQGYYQEPQSIKQPWRTMQGLHLSKVLSVDPATGLCGVEMRDGSQPVPCHVVAPNANAGNGLIWLPQVGDIVVVAFLQGNASMPVILGSLYAKNDTLHSMNDGDLTIRHQSGSSVVISKDGTVTVTGKRGALVTLKENGDLEAKHATSLADVVLDSTGVTVTQDTAKLHVGTDKVKAENASGASIEIGSTGVININPGPSAVLNLAGGGELVCRSGDITSSPFGGAVADHYHLLIPSTLKVSAG